MLTRSRRRAALSGDSRVKTESNTHPPSPSVSQGKRKKEETDEPSDDSDSSEYCYSVDTACSEHLSDGDDIEDDNEVESLIRLEADTEPNDTIHEPKVCICGKIPRRFDPEDYTSFGRMKETLSERIFIPGAMASDKVMQELVTAHTDVSVVWKQKSQTVKLPRGRRFHWTSNGWEITISRKSTGTGVKAPLGLKLSVEYDKYLPVFFHRVRSLGLATSQSELWPLCRNVGCETIACRSHRTSIWCGLCRGALVRITGAGCSGKTTRDAMPRTGRVFRPELCPNQNPTRDKIFIPHRMLKSVPSTIPAFTITQEDRHFSYKRGSRVVSWTQKGSWFRIRDEYRSQSSFIAVSLVHDPLVSVYWHSVTRVGLIQHESKNDRPPDLAITCVTKGCNSLACRSLTTPHKPQQRALCGDCYLTNDSSARACRAKRPRRDRSTE